MTLNNNIDNNTKFQVLRKVFILIKIIQSKP